MTLALESYRVSTTTENDNEGEFRFSVGAMDAVVGVLPGNPAPPSSSPATHRQFVKEIESSDVGQWREDYTHILDTNWQFLERPAAAPVFTGTFATQVSELDPPSPGHKGGTAPDDGPTDPNPAHSADTCEFEQHKAIKVSRTYRQPRGVAGNLIPFTMDPGP